MSELRPDFEPGWVMRRMGAALVASGVISLIGAAIDLSGFAFLLCVLAVLFWVNGGVLLWCGTKVRPVVVQPGRNDYDPV